MNPEVSGQIQPAVAHMFEVSLARHLPVIVLAIAAIAGFITLVVLSRSVRSKINMTDLLLGDDGKMSRSAFVLLASFGVTTWGMVYMWLNEKMTEGYFAAYLAAWVAPAVTKLIVNSQVATAQAAGPTPPPVAPIVGTGPGSTVTVSPVSVPEQQHRQYQPPPSVRE